MNTTLEFDRSWYDFIEEVAGAFYGALGSARATLGETAPLSPLLTVRSGYAESPGWFMVQAAEFDPEPLTVENLRVRDVYGSESLVRALLELMASETWFDRTARDEYVLTPAGRDMLERIFARRRARLERIVVSDRVPLAEIEHTMRVLVQASCAMEPAWCVKHSRRRAPLQEICPLGTIFQAFEDFNAIRDDAHMVAWQPTGASGHEWETFAFVLENRAVNADALFEQLYYRGFTRAEYRTTLDALAARGWLEKGADSTWSATTAGFEIHEAVEATTNQSFFAPWTGLAKIELVQFKANLELLQNELVAFAS